ncbi:MAG: translation initiation factor IF-2 [Bacillota bacterium]
MAKIRVYELAKELLVSNKDLVAKLQENNIEAKSHMSMIGEGDAEQIRKLYKSGGEAKKETLVTREKQETPQQKPQNSQKQGQKPKQDAKPQEQKPQTQQQKPQGQQQKPQTQQQKPQGQQQKPQGQQQKTQGQQQKTQGQQEVKPQEQKQAPAPQQAQQTGKKKKDKKKDKKEQRVKENPMERRRREMEEEAALMAELEALEAEERALHPETLVKMAPATMTVKDLAEILEKKGSDLVMLLMKKGKMVNINAQIDFDLASELALNYNVLLEEEPEVDIMEAVFAEEEEDEKLLKTRPPVVVVMGHVDHGKTSLLDSIRQSSVTKGEAGGITQHIGAYTVKIDGKPITFLDTPGHEAFTAMRMRGAQITDIAILVVAADDGVMPQTIEAINHAKAAGVEIIVAINKMDKPSANPDRVKQELTEYELVAEDWGGSTVCVPVSAVSKEGIDNLLEMIILVSEMKELKANPNKKARGVIVEAELDKGRGTVATVLIQSGTLQIGDPVVAGCAYGKIRAMIDDKGRHVKKAGPSQPVEILGLSEVPTAGDGFYAAENDKQARHVAESIVARQRENLIKETPQKVSLDDLFSQIQSGTMKELNVVVKADVQGSVEAMRQSLERLTNEEVRVRIIHGGVGAITESDVMLASASNAIIIGFNVRPEPVAKEFADREKVDLRQYRVIYNAIEDISSAMKGMLDPIYEEKVIGHAEVRQLFKASGIGTIAGSYVKDGKFVRGCLVRISRRDSVIFEGELDSLKRFKDDVKEVTHGFECGLVFKKFNDIEEGDWVEAYIMVEVPR